MRQGALHAKRMLWKRLLFVGMPAALLLSGAMAAPQDAGQSSGKPRPPAHAKPQDTKQTAPGGLRSASTFWAFVPPKMPTLPRVKNESWIRNPIDRFVLAGLEAKGLKPAPPVDRRTLIRRATFDLTGLPPTPQEIQDFLNDTRPDAYARVVDRLLASPAYGERWGRHWLDVARYADSNGVDENLVYANAWRYRDYVIRALNQDKPISRFIQEQIAGDLLPKTGEEAGNLDRILATGYLALGPKMLAEDDPVKQEEDIIDEQIDTLGKTFLGITLGCARCHDHKFDPFPQTDYYALAGIFKSTRTMMNFKNMAEWQEIPLISQAAQEKLAGIEKAVAVKRADQEGRRKRAGDLLVAEAGKNAERYLLAARESLRRGTAEVSLPPVMAKADRPLPPGALSVEAEDFVRGNVLKDREGYGKGIGVLVNAGQYPNRTEYEVAVPTAGPYQCDLRYASGDSRPIRLYVNGALVASHAAGKVTGGFYPDRQQWFAEGVFLLKAGKNQIMFERDSFFPHIDKFLLTPYTGSVYPRTPEQIAAETSLVPEFLAQAEAQLKQAGSAASPALKFTFPENGLMLLPADVQSEIKRLDDEIAALEKSKPAAPRAMAVSEAKPTNLRVHLRGSYLTLGQECTRQFPAVLAGTRSPSIDLSHSGRAELARWLTQEDNPLTARVFVNRVWRWHFGRGIVASTDNFGMLGDRPTNQPLLDWLAVTFVKEGGCNWSLKKLHRLILLSNTYQESNRYDARAVRIDPENLLHWRNSRRRLEAEEIRDSILMVSGALDRTMGGTLLTFKDREYVTSTANADPVNYRSMRRSVYLPVIRSALYDVYTAFDFGDPTVMNGDRPSTTVAPQALFLMNSALMLEQTKAMATMLLARPALDEAGRIRFAYETCYGRPATEAEVVRARQFLRRIETAYAAGEPKAELRSQHAWQSLCKALLTANEFLYVD